MRLSHSFILFGLLTSGIVAACDSSSDAQADEAPAARRVNVEVGATGYTPGAIDTVAGQPITLVFRRTTDEGCGGELVFPDHNIRRTLPLNEDVVVELTPQSGETINFTCGMGMYRGSVVASQ